MEKDFTGIAEENGEMELPRILITAGKSGAGKTMITCGLLAALKRRGLGITAYKCGPDYIDPMFHRETLGICSYNLDIFLCGRENVKKLLWRHWIAKERATGKLAVIEGAMGYYDGLGGVSCEASAYDVADATDTPAVLIVDCKGTSVSVIPYIRGFLEYQDKKSESSHIYGVILNRISPMMYGRMKDLIEKETSARVYGYVPEIKDLSFESRYLGLKLPGEIKEVQEKIDRLGDIIEETLDIDGFIKLAGSARPLKLREDSFLKRRKPCGQEDVRIGVAMDEAFCFIYQDNLDILQSMGAEIVPFSPIHDNELPAGLDGVVFYGGYPELYAGKLSRNRSMREQIRRAVLSGLPCIAECGGFMYLTEEIRDESGTVWTMCGVFDGKSYYTPSLRRFGYVTLCGGKVFERETEDIFAHEFHYYDSEQCGQEFEAKKPLSDRAWRCMISTDSVLAGYPHIHYAGSPKVAEAFIKACQNYGRSREKGTYKSMP